MNSKQKGDTALAQAINYYMSNGQEVSLPIGDKRPYDLIVEMNNTLKKVQCKYTSSKSAYGIYVVDLRITGGNQSFYTSKKYQTGDFDLLFVSTDTMVLYQIPFEAINKNKINLGEKYAEYCLN